MKNLLIYYYGSELNQIVDIPTSANTTKAAEPTKKDNTNPAKHKTPSSLKGVQTKETSKSDKSHTKGTTTPKPAKNPRQKDASQKGNTGRRTPLYR